MTIGDVDIIPPGLVTSGRRRDAICSNAVLGKTRPAIAPGNKLPNTKVGPRRARIQPWPSFYDFGIVRPQAFQHQLRRDPVLSKYRICDNLKAEIPQRSRSASDLVDGNKTGSTHSLRTAPLTCTKLISLDSCQYQSPKLQGE